MGRVTVAAKIENYDDLADLRRGRLQPGEVRTIEVPDALVDTGASGLSLPRAMIEQLGLAPVRQRNARTSAGPIVVNIYESVRLTIQERVHLTDVMELPDDCPVLIGQQPLGTMDFVVAPPGRRLIGNPAHGGEPIIELF